VKKNIIIVLGEPNSISSEIFLKSINYIKKSKLNFIIIGNYSLFKKQANYLNYKKNINFRLSKIDNLKKTKFNFINIDYKQSKPFDLKTNKTDEFVKNVLSVQFSYLKKN
jgi:4-hydroxy-L-threonine phosphate dehydrogenase PdxA